MLSTFPLIQVKILQYLANMLNGLCWGPFHFQRCSFYSPIIFVLYAIVVSGFQEK